MKHNKMKEQRTKQPRKQTVQQTSKPASNLSLQKIRLSEDFFIPATWQEARIHQLLLTQRDLIRQMEEMKLEQLMHRQQITAIVGAINLLLEANHVKTV